MEGRLGVGLGRVERLGVPVEVKKDGRGQGKGGEKRSSRGVRVSVAG